MEQRTFGTEANELLLKLYYTKMSLFLLQCKKLFEGWEAVQL